jgi:hypothetical protein
VGRRGLLPRLTRLGLEIQVTGAVPYRDAPISLWVDSDQSLVELNDQNNVATSNADCALPDLALGYLQPRGPPRPFWKGLTSSSPKEGAASACGALAGGWA